MQEDLVGELSVRLGELQAAARTTAACEVAQLRREVETRPASRLATEMIRALILADQVCWDSLYRGDVQAFDRQAAISADLQLFGTSARLIDDS